MPVLPGQDLLAVLVTKMCVLRFDLVSRLLTLQVIVVGLNTRPMPLVLVRHS